MKFSLKTLLAATAYAAILAAGLVVASDFWSRTVFLVTFVAIALAATAAFFPFRLAGPLGVPLLWWPVGIFTSQ